MAWAPSPGDNEQDQKNNDGLNVHVPSTDNDELKRILKLNNLYGDLHQILNDNGVDLEMLQHDLSLNEIDEFCTEIGLSFKQKLKFRKLMRIVTANKNPPEHINNDDEADQNNFLSSQINDNYQQVQPDGKVNVILIGDTNAGKTSLMRRYRNNKFDPSFSSSIGIDSTQIMQKLNDKNIEVNVFDTGGQERYQYVGRAWYRRADCFLICYDSSIEKALVNLPYWTTMIEEHGPDDVIVILVGCKRDIANEEIRRKNRLDAERIIGKNEYRKFDAMHFQCSAKTTHNVKIIFRTAVEALMELRKHGRINQNNVIQLHQVPQEPRNRNKLCC